MQETIRDRIKRRVRWTMGAAVIGWLLVASPGITGAVRGRPPSFVIGASIVGFLLFFGAIASMWFIRCPKCSARIGHTIAMPVGFSFGVRQRVNYCPFCGVNLDEPIDASGNPITR